MWGGSLPSLLEEEEAKSLREESARQGPVPVRTISIPGPKTMHLDLDASTRSLGIRRKERGNDTWRGGAADGPGDRSVLGHRRGHRPIAARTRVARRGGEPPAAGLRRHR